MKEHHGVRHEMIFPRLRYSIPSVGPTSFPTDRGTGVSGATLETRHIRRNRAEVATGYVESAGAQQALEAALGRRGEFTDAPLASAG